MSTQTSFARGGESDGALVTIFLRGGADGLNMVAPLEDAAYYRARPNLALAKNKALALDGFYGLNPLLAELLPAWNEGELAIVHGAGSEDQTRSHFEAQDTMEHGGLAGGGWLGRYLRARPGAANGALSCVAIGRALPESLQGAPSAAVLGKIEDFSFSTGSAGLRAELQKLYAQQGDHLGAAARDTFNALGRIDAMRAEKYRPANGAVYGSESFGQGLLQIAQLIKAEVGLQAASLDLDGWDSHFVEQTVHANLLPQLARGLAAFRQDLGPKMKSTTLVIMSEFGRRVGENASAGTDHGRGGVMWVLGGGVKGGRVIGPWPGLGDAKLEGPGDLPVFNNYRNVLAPILQRHGLAKAGLPRVFPDFELKPLELY
jgi:uncharacterized protein (DUF1501 family)